MLPTEHFLRSEFFSLSLQAATQRIRVYADGTTETERVEVRTHLRELLEKRSSEYATSVPEERHLANLRGISTTLSRRHSGLLANGKFSIASAQKALNLYLKYLWCAGMLPMPPHCPLDALVLRAGKVRSVPNWTSIDTIEQYTSVVAELRHAAKAVPLAEWELNVYNQSDA